MPDPKMFQLGIEALCEIASLVIDENEGGEKMPEGTEETPVVIVQSKTGRKLVEVFMDGTIKYGESYEPDEDERKKWEDIFQGIPYGVVGYGFRSAKIA